MKADFTKSQESAQKTINDLKAKVELKEKQIQELKKQHEEQLNTLIRGVIKAYNELGLKFINYKKFAEYEIEVAEKIIEGKDDIIKDQ